MKPLVTTTLVCRWFCICAPEDNSTTSKKIAYILLTSIAFVVTLALVAASMTFFMKNVSNDLEEALYALCQIVVHSGLLYVIIVAFFLRHKIRVIFNSLAEIYDASKIIEFLTKTFNVKSSVSV